MVIIGIDPGTATTGYGVIRQTPNRSGEFEIVSFGVITTDKKLSDAERLSILYKDLNEIIDKHKPGKIGVEKLFFTTNQTTAMTVSQSRGVVLLVAQQHKLSIKEFTPLQVKNILTGYGKADKKQVQYMVQHTFGLKTLPRPDDAADALAIALCAALTK